MKSLKSIFFSSLLAVLVAACVDHHEPPLAELPTPTAIAFHKIPLHNTELLSDPRVTIVCDHGDGARIDCSKEGFKWSLVVDSNPSTFARIAIRFDPVEDPLTGDETLLIRAQFESKETHYLYLVQQDGKRIEVPLHLYNQYSYPDLIALPLREIHDEEGNAPDFAAVREVQLAFEYAEFKENIELRSVQFASVWREDIHGKLSLAAQTKGLSVLTGFLIEPIADKLNQATQIAFTDQGDMLVSLQEGKIWWYSDRDATGVYRQRHLWAAGFEEVVGLLYDATDGAVWVGGRGKLYRTLDSNRDGVADIREVRLAGLLWGRHQNNGLAWNPDPDPFSGEAGGTWLYFGLGSTDDLVVGGDLNATILRFPRNGSGQDDLEVVSRGSRNAYGLVWAQLPVDLDHPGGATAWQLFASENGPDFNDAPDEVNHIRWNHDYGFPNQFGATANDAVDGKPYSGPVYPVTAHASADGIVFIGNPAWPLPYRTLYVSLFGEVFSPTLVGHIVEGVKLHEIETATGKTYRGEPFTFVQGLDRPLPLAVDPEGNLLVGDYGSGILYRVSYVGK